MTMRLTKGLYGHEFQSASTLFGLCCGQMRSGAGHSIHNGGWYNHLGEKIGWGDLSSTDLARISNELSSDEIFVVLPESASFWNFVKKVGPIGSMCTTEPTEKAPGVDYIRKHCFYIIKPGKVIRVNDYSEPASGDILRKDVSKEF